MEYNNYVVVDTKCHAVWKDTKQSAPNYSWKQISTLRMKDITNGIDAHFLPVYLYYDL